MRTHAFAAAIAATLSICGSAQAAEVPDPAALAARVEILTRAARPTEIPLSEPQPVDLSLAAVPGAGRDLTEGVTAKAYARYVTVEDKKIGQVVLVGVEKNGRRESLDSSRYTAQFELEAARLEPGAPVTVQGDAGALIEALKRLAAQAPVATVTEEKPTVVEAANDGAKEAGTNAPRNDLAAGYQTPDAVQVAASPTEAVRVSTEGCPVRIDLAAGRAIQQSKTVTTKDGAVTDESACTDGAEGFTLQRSYSVCTDEVDLAARTATARYLLYYVDAGGARQEVSECSADPELVFPIVESFGGCAVLLDYTAQKAIPQSALIYRDASNAEVQVRGCQASESKAASAMTRTTSGCSIRHDFAAGRSYQQGTWTYVADGITYQAGGCSDTGVEYAHEKVYEADGQYVCTPIVDLQANTATLQSRLRISVDGIKQYVSDCTPDTSGALPVVSTTGGCENPSTWEHDLGAGVSYGEERWYYLRNGVPSYVTDCQRSSSVYPHQVETVGWQNHDDQLFALPVSTLYITPPYGRYDLKTAQVLQGATQMPYQLTGTASVANGQNEYSGCDVLRLTDLVETWRRPDATEYQKKIGTGTPIGPVDVCVDVLAAEQSYTTGATSSQTGSWCGQGSGFCSGDPPYPSSCYIWITNTWHATAQRWNRVNDESKAVIASSCKFRANTWQEWSSQSSSCGGGSNTGQTLAVPPCPTGL